MSHGREPDLLSSNAPGRGAPGRFPVPLCVDLDGTLVRTDILAESVVRLARRRPLALLGLSLALLRGRSRLKAAVAAEVTIEPAALPYNVELLDFLREERRQGRRLLLVTACHRKPATAVAEHLALFDEVLATDGAVNLKSRRKRSVLVERFGEGGFDYAGNSTADLPVWSAAREAIVVNAPRRLERRLGDRAKRVLDAPRMSRGPLLLRSLRPRRWLEDLVVFLPAVVAQRLLDPASLGSAMMAFLSFGLGGSAIDVLKELLDLETDRGHPRRRLRPFAAGDLSPQTGLAWMLLLAGTSLALALALPPGVLAMLLPYLVLATVDILCGQHVVLAGLPARAGLYAMRVVAGAAAISTAVSGSLLVLCVIVVLAAGAVTRSTASRHVPGEGGRGRARRLACSYPSWGLYPPAHHQEVRRLFWRHEPFEAPPDGKTALPRGLGRSYGDSCLNDGGILLDATGLDRFLDFDDEAGVLRCEGGVSLAAVLDVIVPRGWFLPVTPGTKFVTVAGALANDIHGKNHHRAGTFGCHVTRFELLRSDGERIVCSTEASPGMFRATIGGLGLTGLVTWVEFRLKRISSDRIDLESVRFANVDEFFGLVAESDRDFEYTVAWIDCLATGRNLGRGLLLRGNHAAGGASPIMVRRPSPGFRVPMRAPQALLNPMTLRAFNALYYRRQRRQIERRTVHYEPFFYPLDGIHNWNLLYGRRGFFQYQCLVPPGVALEATRELLARVGARGQGSFLAVLKVFGKVASPGLLSFPRPGATLALDFANRGPRTLALLDELDDVVRGAGGRVYPAKDARMSAQSFRAYFPEWRELATFVDPQFSSSFWRRVTGQAREGSERCPSAC